jgi:hypothetical protein
MKALVTILVSFLLLVMPLNDDKKQQREKMLNKVFISLEENIANPKWLEEPSFIAFKKLLYTDSILSLNDKEFKAVFDQERWSLPFTHFQILKKTTSSTQKKDELKKESKSPVSWNAIDDETAYLKINTFSIPGSLVAKALNEIGTEEYNNLIIDLRDNGGGNLEGPLALGRFLTQEPIDAGYYLTRKWFENHNQLPSPMEVQEMPFLQDFTYTGIKKMFAEEEAFRMVIPGHTNPVFKGKVYILINKWTASACEPLIDLIKKNQFGTLVGETSCGGMLSGAYFDINDTYEAFIPIADYYTAQGVKIDKVGVQPHIEVEPSTAKEYVLDLIK